MQTSRILTAAAIALAFSATGAFAADGCRTIANGVQRCDGGPSQGERSRDAVVAELHNAEANGKMNRVGEMAEAPVSDPVPAPAVALTRAQVKQQLALARANHQMPPIGDRY